MDGLSPEFQAALAEAEAKGRAEVYAEAEAKAMGAFWDTIEDTWQLKVVDFAGSYARGKDIRLQNKYGLYFLKEEVVNALTNSNVATAAAAAEISSEFDEDDSVVSIPSFEEKNDHLRNLLGEKIDECRWSSAHVSQRPGMPHVVVATVPNGQQTSRSPLPYDIATLTKLANMRCSKLVFAGAHNHIYTTP